MRVKSVKKLFKSTPKRPEAVNSDLDAGTTGTKNSVATGSADMDDLRTQLNDMTLEYRATVKRLEDAEEKLTAYESVTREAYQEVDHMQSQLKEEQRCLETAVRVASQLYSKNTELKEQSVKRKSQELSERRKKWLAQHRREEPVEMHTSAEILHFDGWGQSDTDSDMTDPQQQRDEDSDEDLQELTELANLETRTKTDLQMAQEEILELKQANLALTAKVEEFERSGKENVNKIEQLKAVIAMKDCELKEIRQKYDVESQVRQRAETYAARMYGKNKAFKRNSLFLKSGKEKQDPDDNLQEAMKELEKLSKQLEEERVQSQHKIQELEDKLAGLAAEGETSDMEVKINLLTLQVDQLKTEKSALEEANNTLEFQIKALKRDTLPLPPPPPLSIPPPPPPLQTMPGKPDAIKSLYDIIAERKASRANAEGEEKGASQARKKSSTLPVPIGNYSNAMEEMMLRIKSGNALKKTAQYATIEGGTYCSIQEKANTEDKKSDDVADDDSDDDDHIYSLVGADGKKKPTSNAWSTPGVNIDKAATFGGYASPKDAWGPPVKDATGVAKFRFGLRTAKPRILSAPNISMCMDDATATVPDADSDVGGRRLKRDGQFQDSVKLPKNINPDLRRLLDKRRMGMKRAQANGKAGTQ